MIFEEKTLSSQRIYEGRILNLRVDTVTTINGTSQREIIEHKGGAVIVAVTPEKKIVLVRQYRKAIEGAIWEVPAGKIEEGDVFFTSAVRELEEETGYKAGKLELLTKMLPTVGYASEELYIYLATELTPGIPHPDDSEALEVKLVDLKEAVSLVMQGELRDAKTIVAILMAKERLGE